MDSKSLDFGMTSIFVDCVFNKVFITIVTFKDKLSI